jgi:hypothetical protein
MNNEFMEMPNEYNEQPQPPRSPEHHPQEMPLFHNDPIPEAIEGEEWIDYLPDDDAYTTEEQDNIHELDRWASWTKPINEIPNEMFSLNHWNIKPPYEEFYIIDDDEFKQIYEDELDLVKKHTLYNELMRREDRNWDFFCIYNIDEDQRRKEPGFEILKSMLESGLQNRSLNTLCNNIQDCYFKYVQPYLQCENNRPPRYLWRRTIRNHIMYHVPTIINDVELTFRHLNDMAKNLHITMYQTNRLTKQMKVKPANITAYINVIKAKKELYRYLQTLRCKKKK